MGREAGKMWFVGFEMVILMWEWKGGNPYLFPDFEGEKGKRVEVQGRHGDELLEL
jgi:hypothetical protein